MASSLRKAQVELFCKLCENKNVVIWKCLKCKDLFCNDCKKVHQKLSATKNHRVVSLVDFNQEMAQQNEESVMTCVLHNKSCKLFCEECSETICKKCSVKEHSGHEFRKISDLRRRIEERAKALLFEIEIRQNSYDEFKGDKSATKEKIDMELKERQQNLNKIIKKRYETLRKELNTFYIQTEKQVQIAYDSDSLLELQSRQSLLEDIIQTKNITKMVTRFGQIQDDVEDSLANIPFIKRIRFQPCPMVENDLLLEFGSLSLDKLAPIIDMETLEIIKKVETDFKRITLIRPMGDDLIWISDFDNEILQVIDNRNLTSKPINQISMCVEDGCVFDDRLFVAGTDNVIKCISPDGSVTIFKEMEPLILKCIHIALSGDIILGVHSSNSEEDDNRCLVMQMTVTGDVKREIEYDKRGIRLFMSPHRCTVNENNNDILIVDLTDGLTGRVICVSDRGDVRFKYFGNLSLELTSAFGPSAITCKEGAILINDYVNNGIHLLNHDGILIRYISYNDFDIEHPLSLDFDRQGRFWLGSVAHGDESMKRAKIYQAKFS